MKYLVLIWDMDLYNGGGWRLYHWDTNRRKAEQVFRKACLEYPDAKLVMSEVLKEQTL